MRTKFYRIFMCSIIMAHTAASTGNYYFKPNDRFEPSKHIFNGRFTPEDSINPKNINNINNNYNTENRERDYTFSGKINHANLEVGNLPLPGHSTSNELSGYIDPSYENYNNNFNFLKEQLPYHVGKYSVNNNSKESDFGKYRHFDSSQFSNDHHHEGSFHTDFISGNYPARVPSSFRPVGYEQDSDTSMIDDTYINNDNHQFYGKQRGINFNSKGNYNYGDDALKIFSSDIFNIQENQKIKDQIQNLNQNHGHVFDDLSSSISNNYNSNVQDKDVNFHKPERPTNYRGTKYSIYPSKSNLNYLIKEPKKNYETYPNNYEKGNGKAIIIKIAGFGIHPRYVYSTRLYPNIKGNLNTSYKKKRNNLLNRPRNKPIPVHSHNNDNANNDYDDLESSELYNRNSKYTDSLSSDAFASYS